MQIRSLDVLGLPEAECLGDVGGLCRPGPVEVGDCPGHFEHPGGAATGESIGDSAILEELSRRFGHLRLAADMGFPQLSIEKGLAPFLLSLMSLEDALSDCGRLFGLGAAEELPWVDDLHRYMEVDAVEYWSRESTEVSMDFAIGAGTGLGCAPSATWAGVAGHNHGKTRWILNLARGAGDPDAAFLQWLAQHFDDGPVEFSCFIEEEHSIVRQTHLSRTKSTISHEARHGD